MKIYISCQSTNVFEIKELLRQGFLRNFAGILHPSLHPNSCTKKLILDYLSTTVDLLNYIAQISMMEGWKLENRISFFNHAQSSFGKTALMLEGGATFGLYHLGVIKCLLNQKLLPKIIAGSSVGALIAALVCIHSDEELPLIFEKGGIDLNAFSTKSKDGNLQRKFKRLLKYGYLLDIKVLEDCVKSNVGNYTFQEAFNKTGRVLNIVVSSSRKNEIPNVLNYITAPTVLIWSACCASVAVFGLYKSIDLLAKDSNGDIYPFNSSEINWGEAVNDNDNAEHRLSELFGVNHFIISQASQVLAPLISLMIGGKSHGEDISAKVGNLVSNEIRHRIKQLAYLGLVPNQIQRLFVSGMKINSNSNIKIEPHIYLNDARDVFSNPTAASLDYWILKGQQSTFPFVENIKCRMMIEIAIEDILARVTALGGVKEKEEPEVVDIRRNMSYNGRSSSFHVQI